MPDQTLFSNAYIIPSTLFVLLLISIYLSLRWRQHISRLNQHIINIENENTNLKKETSELKHTANRIDLYSKKFQFILGKIEQLRQDVVNKDNKQESDNQLNTQISSVLEKSLAGTDSSINDDEESSLNAGIRKFMKTEYEEAYKLLLAPAEAGHIKACTLIAKMYFAGNGVEKDHEKYVYWLEKSAKAGDRTAKAKLKKMNHAVKS